MHALNRSDYAVPVIMENHLRRLAGDEPGGRALMPRILLALPNPALSFMPAVPDAGKRTADRPRWSASGRDHSGIWLRNAAAGLCLLAAAAAVVSFTAQYRMVEATRRLRSPRRQNQFISARPSQWAWYGHCKHERASPALTRDYSPIAPHPYKTVALHRTGPGQANTHAHPRSS